VTLAVSPDAIPAALREGRRFVVWKLEARDGKPTKVPYRIRGGGKASSNDSATWGLFSDAALAAKDFDGIGIMLAGGTVSCIDLDHCRDPETGLVDEPAAAVIRELDSYTEVSPSGTGVHVFVVGTPPAGRRRHGYVEMYGPADNRFMTLTGHPVDLFPHRPVRRVDLAALHSKLFPHGEDDRAGRTENASLGASPCVTDFEVIERAAAAGNGEKFRRLFVEGDFSDYPSHSEGRYALLCILAFWTQDEEQLYRLMERSALWREDPDLPRKLRVHDIPGAVAATTERYEPASVGIGAITKTAPERKPNGRKIRRASNVKPGRVSWLWKGYLPYGKITILDGDPGIGKSFIALDLAARVSTGRPMPFASPAREPRGVVLLMPEDDDEDTIVPRLIALDADLKRIVIISQTFDVSAPDGLEHLAEALDMVDDAGLVVFDPLLTYLGGEKSDVHRDRDVRRSLDPLIELAIRRKLVILGNRHLTKAVKDGGNALYRGMGSIGIIAVSRVGLVVARNPEGEGNVLAVSKNNLCAKPSSLSWHIEPDADDEDLARVVWDERVAVDADALVTGPEAARGGSDKGMVQDAILTYLTTHGGDVPSSELLDYLDEAVGASRRTIQKWRHQMPNVEVYATATMPPVWMTRLSHPRQDY
jgi:hypothetical protein